MKVCTVQYIDIYIERASAVQAEATAAAVGYGSSYRYIYIFNRKVDNKEKDKKNRKKGILNLH